MEITKSLRYRVQIARGMKGSVSFEATVDGEGYTQKEILDKSNKLVSELESKYPIVP